MHLKDVIKSKSGFTQRQAELAIALQNHMTLKQFAHESGLSLETVRSILKRIYRNTGVNSRHGLILWLRSANASEDRVNQPTDQLKYLHGFTPREADIVKRLLQGMSTADIADELGIKRSTIRFHLKSIYAKTWTHSQVELVERLLDAALLIDNPDQF